MKEFAATLAGQPLRLRYIRMGEDVCLTLCGGDREHIGAVAVAQPRPSLADPARASATASVIALPGHQEDLLARELALKVAASLNVAVCVVCGIHLRHPAPALLDEALAASRGLVDALLAEIRNANPDKGMA